MTHAYAPYFKTGTLSEQSKNQQCCKAYGYYLVRKSDYKRFFISKVVDTYALHKVADKVLSDELGWDYWIDRNISTNPDVPMWVNLDFTDRFL